jgi:CDP-paratose 2-epimerase
MKSILITGGAGFIGINSARYFHERNWSVTILDNLSRRGAADNLDWLRRGQQVRFEHADIRNFRAMERIIHELRPSAVLHLAAQVAVTTAVSSPREDFETNALGTFNVLEAVRTKSPKTFFINASTNKVYGKMEDTGIVKRNGRYEYSNFPRGVGEDRPLDFHSPYGCSKGAADQYTIDYARIYGLSSVTFRQSCIYGPRQFGIEDQGWVAWFAIAAALGKKITIYGDGKQTRDVLQVQDLARAYEAAFDRREAVSGQAFNIGGGPSNTISLLELIRYLEEELGSDIPLQWGDWRPGDQPVFVCNLEKAKRLLRWQPLVPVREGVRDLIRWVRENKELFDDVVTDSARLSSISGPRSPRSGSNRPRIRHCASVRSPRLDAASLRKAALNKNSIPLSKTINTP